MIQAVIVAGGEGRRMRPVLNSVPKPMMDVGGEPLLQRQIQWLRNAGIRDVFMCLGYQPDSISGYFGDGSRWGMNIQYQVETRPRGTAGAVRDLGAKVAGDLLVVYGDLFIDMDCGRLLDFHAGHDGAATLVVRATDHPMDSDLVRVEGDRIVSVYRPKPGEAVQNLACAAIWVIRPRLLRFVAPDAPSDFAKDVFPKALAEGETLMAYRTQEPVLDLGTPERAAAFLRKWPARK